MEVKVDSPVRTRPVSVTVESQAKRWWTSDLHFGHAKIAEYCPDRQNLVKDYDKAVVEGSAVHQMNEALIANWNSVVDGNDDVMIIGDLAMGKIDESLALVSRLNGNKKLVPGNHDRCWAYSKRQPSKDWVQIYKDAGLEIWPEQVLLPLGDHTVMVCHFPYRGDSHDEDRYKFARPFDEGRFLICGHVHDTWLTDGKQINVGVDVWDYKPVPDSELIRLIWEIENGK